MSRAVPAAFGGTSASVQRPTGLMYVLAPGYGRAPYTTMPRYHIDTDDGRTPIVDEGGHALADARSARDLTLRALSDMLCDDPGAGDRRAFTARVRSEDGAALYSATLTLTGEWAGGSSAT